MTPQYSITDEDMKLLRELYGHLDDFDCGWLYNFGADAMAALERVTTAENLTPVPTYKGALPYSTVGIGVSFSSPEPGQIRHDPTELCPKTELHPTGECKEFTGGA